MRFYLLNFKKTSKDDHVKKLNDYKAYIEFELKLVKEIENRTLPASIKNKPKSNKIDDENSTNEFEIIGCRYIVRFFRQLVVNVFTFHRRIYSLGFGC